MKTSHVDLTGLNLDVMTLDNSETGNFKTIFEKYIHYLLEYEAATPEYIASNIKHVGTLMSAGSQMLTSFVEILTDIKTGKLPAEDVSDLRYMILLMSKIMNRVNIIAQHHYNPSIVLPPAQEMFEGFLRDSGYVK